MILKLLNAYRRAAFEFQDYRPTKITWQRLRAWLDQFDKSDHDALLDLLQHVRYVSETDARRALADQNQALLRQLQRGGIPPKKIIYVQVHDAGSSSPV